MKTLRFLAVLSIVLGFAVNTAQSRAVVIKEDLDPWFSSYLDDGKEIWYPAGVWHQVTDEIIITSDGMFKTVNFAKPGKE